MVRPHKTKIQYSSDTVFGGRSKLISAVLVVVTLVVIPSNAPGQSVQTVVTDLSVIADGGIGKKFIFPAANSGGLQMPRDLVRSRLHVTPKKAVRAIRINKPRNKIKTAPQKKLVTGTEKSPPQPVATPGPKPKVTTTKVPKQKPNPLAKVIKKPPPMPKLKEEAPTLKISKVPPSAPAEPAITSKTSQNTVVSTGVTLKPGRAMSVVFEGFATDLPAVAKTRLNELANTMRDTKEYRLQLMAYAGGKGLLTSKVRRISLSRALAVRSFLIEKGIRSTQIDVRALGNKTSEKPVNRVDVNLAQR